MEKLTKICFYFLLLTGILIILTSSCKKSNENTNINPPLNTIKDVDGNIYHSVTIGTQVWMVENLRVTKYRNGDSIPYVTDNSWGTLTAGAYCWYDNNTSNKTVYGALYNWIAVNDNRKIAPAGWHVPTDAEWTTLTTYLGGEPICWDKLKETGTAHWSNSNSSATNSSGFTALPGGYREWTDNQFYSSVDYASFWTSTEENTGDAWCRIIGASIQGYNSGRYGYEKLDGMSVRCLKD